MQRIQIDDEVYKALETHARGFQQPNDVLRVLLGLDGAASGGAGAGGSDGNGSGAATGGPVRSGRGVHGRLYPLLQSGLVAAGDGLVHKQKRKGGTFKAKIEADGRVSTSTGPHDGPSPALGEQVGTAINGWVHWTHEPSGKTLDELRRQAGLI